MWFSSLAIFIIFLASPLSAFGEVGGYCQTKYGKGTVLTFEPVEANSGVTVEENILGKPKIKRDKRVPHPIGFRCIFLDFKGSSKDCPVGMKYNTKRLENPTCLSKIFSMKELCPSEIENTWPELGGKVCGEH